MQLTANPSVLSALQARLPKMNGDNFSLVAVPAEDVMLANIEAVKILEAEGYSGVYVTLSKDYLSVSSALDSSGVDLHKIKFVDAISRMYGIAPIESDEVVYVDGPLSADALIAGITDSVRALKTSKRFVLLDSLTTVLLYNSLDATADFGKMLRKLLDKEGAAGVVVVAYKGEVNDDVISRIAKNSAEVVLVGA